MTGERVPGDHLRRPDRRRRLRIGVNGFVVLLAGAALISATVSWVTSFAKGLDD